MLPTNYDQYGNQNNGQAQDDKFYNNPYSYRGYYRDVESGLYYLKGRYYDPTTQRFTQEDTYKGNNPYGYCNGNPVNGIDPNGRYAPGDTVIVNGRGNGDSYGSSASWTATYADTPMKIVKIASGRAYPYALSRNFTSTVTGWFAEKSISSVGSTTRDPEPPKPKPEDKTTTVDPYDSSKIGGGGVQIIPGPRDVGGTAPMKKPNPNGLFFSIDAAVKAFVDIWNIHSIANNWEYGTFIYAVLIKDSMSGHYNHIYMYSYYDPWTDKAMFSVSVTSVVYNYKDIYKIVATVHTHGAYGENNFSAEDKDNAIARKLDSYVITPKGSIKKYDYLTKKVSMLSYTTYHNPNMMGFFGFFHSQCSLCAF